MDLRPPPAVGRVLREALEIFGPVDEMALGAPVDTVAPGPIVEADVEEFVPGRPSRVRVLLADDHSIFLAGLNALFEGQPGMDVVGHARDGEEAILLACTLKPDVVLLDVTMPGLDGLTATRRIRTRADDVKILMLSMHASASTVRRAFHEGAAGYLLKGSSPDDLVRGVRALADDETFLCPKAAGLLMGGSQGRDTAPSAASNFQLLTAREREVLQQIAEGCSSKEIAKALHLSVKTVETHRGRLMRKLDLHSVAALTKCAVREGIASLDG